MNMQKNKNNKKHLTFTLPMLGLSLAGFMLSGQALANNQFPQNDGKYPVEQVARVPAAQVDQEVYQPVWPVEAVPESPSPSPSPQAQPCCAYIDPQDGPSIDHPLSPRFNPNEPQTVGEDSPVQNTTSQSPISVENDPKPIVGSDMSGSGCSLAPYSGTQAFNLEMLLMCLPVLRVLRRKK